MRDFNFFSPFINQKHSYRVRYFNLTIGLTVFLVFFCGYFIFNAVRISDLKSQIRSKEAFLGSPEAQAIVKEEAETKHKLDILNQYYSIIEEVQQRIRNKDRIHSQLLGKINSTVPKEVSFTSLNLDIDGLIITGAGSSRKAIAELEYNLKQLGIFSEVHISSIAKASGSTGELNFSISCRFK